MTPLPPVRIKRTRYRVMCLAGSKCRDLGYPTDAWAGYRIGAGDGPTARRKAAARKPCPWCGGSVRALNAVRVLASVNMEQEA